jgi:hypothetical protein
MQHPQATALATEIAIVGRRDKKTTFNSSTKEDMASEY